MSCGIILPVKMAVLKFYYCLFFLFAIISMNNIVADDEEETDAEKDAEKDVDKQNDAESNTVSPDDKEDSDCEKWVGDKVKINKDCSPVQMDPFQKPTLRERLELALPVIGTDPRYPEFGELHNRHILIPLRPIIPRTDLDFLRLHYRSRGDELPQTKRLDERPGPMYTFQGQESPCDPRYTFERWPGKPENLRPPKRPGVPDKPIVVADECVEIY